jgi:hypothetical protein
MKDTRIVYGAGCTWWDSIDKVGKHPKGLPCCPHCNSMLFEMDGPDMWWSGVAAYEAKGNPGYREMIEWMRGKCFPSIAAAKSAFLSRIQPSAEGE